MVKNKANPFFKTFITLCLVLFASCRTLCQNPQYDNLSFGIPGKADTIIDRPGYALGYIEYHEQLAWVIYIMTQTEATTDMTFSGQTMVDSFFMSNMSPQKPAFNRGIWKDLEALVWYFAITEREIVVVTGPILPKKKTITIGPNQVTVPTHYYKVIFDLTPPRKMIGFILPNEGSHEPLATFAASVDAIEKATGLDFFSKLPKEKQKQLESSFSIRAWQGLLSD